MTTFKEAVKRTAHAWKATIMNPKPFYNALRILGMFVFVIFGGAMGIIAGGIAIAAHVGATDYLLGIPLIIGILVAFLAWIIFWTRVTFEMDN